jgi:hypothetical protein
MLMQTVCCSSAVPADDNERLVSIDDHLVVVVGEVLHVGDHISQRRSSRTMNGNPKRPMIQPFLVQYASDCVNLADGLGLLLPVSDLLFVGNGLLLTEAAGLSLRDGLGLSVGPACH